MSGKYLRLLLTLTLSLFLLTGCWENDLPEEEMTFPVQEETAPQEEHNILPQTFALPYLPDFTLDPISCPDGMQQVVGSLLYEGLFQLDPQFQPQPQLCESYTLSEDGRTYVFTLRPGVSFSDGTPLRGADVKAALTRAKSSERYKARLSQVSRIRAGESSVTITLSAPNTGFPALLDIPIVKSGTEKYLAPIGTGPYLFSAEDSLPGLIANQVWWQGDGQPVERIGLAEASDLEAMLYRFSSHDVQLITTDLTGMDNIAVTGNVSFQDADATILQYVGCNVTREPLNNSALRSALWAGINRSTVISAFLSGHGKAAQFPVSPVSPLYPKELEQEFSREAFTSALNLSGYTGGRPLTLLVNAENPFKVSVAGFLAESLTEQGVPVKLSVLPWAEFTAALAAGRFDLYYGEVRLPADWNLAPLLATGGTLNYGRWADPQTDQLIAAFTAAQDKDAAMKALCQHLRAQAPILPVCFKSTSVLLQADVVEGLTPTAAQPFYHLQDCTIHLAKKPS